MVTMQQDRDWWWPASGREDVRVFIKPGLCRCAIQIAQMNICKSHFVQLPRINGPSYAARLDTQIVV